MAEKPGRINNNEAHWGRRIAAGAVLAGAAVLATEMATAQADPDVTILIPGFGDNNGDGYVAQLANTGQLPQNFVVDRYNADILAGQASIDEGAQNFVNIFNGISPNQTVGVRSYSWGNAPRIQGMHQLAGPDGVLPGNLVESTGDGNPWGPEGFFQNGMAQNAIVEPILNVSGIPTDLVDFPMTTDNQGEADVWGNGADQNPIAVIDQGIQTLSGAPDSHQIQGGQPDRVWQDPDGSTQREWADQDPLTVSGQEGNPDPAFGLGLTNPQGPNYPQQGPELPPPPAPLAVDLAANVVPAGASFTPSFPGELACPGGYFTPGDAPC